MKCYNTTKFSSKNVATQTGKTPKSGNFREYLTLMTYLNRFLAALAVLALGMAGLSAPQAAERPSDGGLQVVATIPPVHSLVAGVMEGAGTPILLLDGNSSPHAYALKPSDARALQQADLIFWIGPDLEAFLQGPLKATRLDDHAIALVDTPGLERHTLGKNEQVDPHIWLDPENAKIMVGHIAQMLTMRDPSRQALYENNARHLVADLDRLTGRLRVQLAPVRTAPYVALHDAYQYFEKRFGMKAQAVFTLSPDRPIGAAHARYVQTLFADGKVACAFIEPQAPSKLVTTLTAGTNVTVATLDAVGAGLTPGPALYETLMTNLADSFSTCLTGSQGDPSLKSN